MEKRFLPSGAWVDKKPNLVLRQELTTEHKEELVDALVSNKSGAQGEMKELAWYWTTGCGRIAWLVEGGKEGFFNLKNDVVANVLMELIVFHILSNEMFVVHLFCSGDFV